MIQSAEPLSYPLDFTEAASSCSRLEIHMSFPLNFPCYPAFLTGLRSEVGGDAGLTRLATEVPTVVLDGTSRRPKEHNAVRTDVYASAAVSW